MLLTVFDMAPSTFKSDESLWSRLSPSKAGSVDEKTLARDHVRVEAHDDELQLAPYRLERRSDGLLYFVNGATNHPRNWSTARKAFDTAVIIALEFYTYVKVAVFFVANTD